MDPAPDHGRRRGEDCRARRSGTVQCRADNRLHRWLDLDGLRWARSATKHRISRRRSRFVIEHHDMSFRRRGPFGRTSRIVFLGEDREGKAIEVIAVPEAEQLLVIHAMPMSPRFQELYEEADKWER